MTPNGPVRAEVEIDTRIGHANTHRVSVRDLDLVDDLIGQVSYAELTLLAITGERPAPGAVRLVDAVLVSLMDHGLTANALAARLNYWVAPEAIQAAVATGLLGAGSRLLGSMEGCGRLLSEIRADIDEQGAPEREAVWNRVQELLDADERVPGVGHNLHRGGDPRAAKLLEVARREGYAQRYVPLVELLPEVLTELTGKALPLNATGAIGALLLEVGVPWRLHRGFALMSRTAGLVAHVGEEIDNPLTPEIRKMLRKVSWIEDGG